MMELKHGFQNHDTDFTIVKNFKSQTLITQIKEELFSPYERSHQQCLMVLHSSNVMPYVPFK